MFTGIVQSLGTLLEAADTGAGKRLVVALHDLASQPIAHGDSVCVNGVCLTVVSVAAGKASFDAITETLNRSTLGRKKNGDRLNLELSLRPDSFVGGHFLQGHVDAVGTVKSIKQDASDFRITFSFPPPFAPVIVPKGSIAVEGVSMTLAEVDPQAATFTLAVIPTTLNKTTLGTLKAGDAVNIETDILARTVVHWLECIRSGQPEGAPPREFLTGGAKPPVTIEKLQQLGFA